MKTKPDEPRNRAAFLTGRLLAMADELHKQYCIAVRSKTNDKNGKLKIEMPTTLIGNGLLARAGDDPASALADLLDRGRIYLGWAKSQVGRGKSDDPQSIAINSALKVVRLFQPVADELNTIGFAGELTAEERAHLFLGYLSPVLGQKEEAFTANQTETEPELEEIDEQ